VPQSASKTNKAQAAYCWWYGDSSQAIAYLMMDCQKWRRARGGMLKELGMDKFAISERRDRIDLEILFGEDAMTAMFQSTAKNRVVYQAFLVVF
jgi:hypothetical protein